MHITTNKAEHEATVANLQKPGAAVIIVAKVRNYANDAAHPLFRSLR